MASHALEPLGRRDVSWGDGAFAGCAQRGRPGRGSATAGWERALDHPEAAGTIPRQMYG
ncbi:hypothetical protein ACFYZ8_23475 [Streptomyces sp. NPDC001668]|uniref:hypothetical protein n=1 Tax=unclassified Streptomyces TaxID=2593676 RepID=UPI003697AE86